MKARQTSPLLTHSPPHLTLSLFVYLAALLALGGLGREYHAAAAAEVKLLMNTDGHPNVVR